MYRLFIAFTVFNCQHQWVPNNRWIYLYFLRAASLTGSDVLLLKHRFFFSTVSHKCTVAIIVPCLSSKGKLKFKWPHCHTFWDLLRPNYRRHYGIFFGRPYVLFLSLNFSYAYATWRTLVSSKSRPVIIMPIGRPSEVPVLILSDGWPLQSNGAVLCSMPPVSDIVSERKKNETDRRKSH